MDTEKGTNLSEQQQQQPQQKQQQEHHQTQEQTTTTTSALPVYENDNAVPRRSIEDSVPLMKDAPDGHTETPQPNDFRLTVEEPEQPLTPSSSIINSPPASIIAYCLASIMMTVVNKFVVSGTHFNMNFLLLFIQSGFSVLCVVFGKKFGLLSFRDFDREDARKWFPISCCLVTVIYTGSKALQYLSIPVYTIFKNLTIILIAYGEVLWFGGSVTSLTLVSFVLMVFSSLVAAWADITNRAENNIQDAVSSSAAASASAHWNIGYFWMVANCITSASYVLVMRKRIKVTNFSDWDTMFYNNLLSLPVLAVASLVVENWSTESLERNFPEGGRGFLLFAMAFSGAAAVGISYTTAWCVRVTSSTTYSMVGALNKLPVAASGIVFFGDPATFGSVGSILLGFVAGVIFAIAKTNSAKMQRK